MPLQIAVKPINPKNITLENTDEFKAQPEKIPRETYQPFLLAVCVLFIGWGLISNYLLSLVGLIGFFIVLAKWIKEMLYERGDK